MPGAAWDPAAPGVMPLPSGELVRGRGLRRPLPPGDVAEFGVYLLAKRPEPQSWDSRWIRWPDLRLPADATQFKAVLGEALARAAVKRVEIACGGGRGRTGTALACLAILDGLPPREAVAYVRRNYDPHGIETPWQRRFVARFRVP